MIRRFLAHLFRLRWETKRKVKIRTCPQCKGAKEVDLPTGKPIEVGEQNANAITCMKCAGQGIQWIPLD